MRITPDRNRYFGRLAISESVDGAVLTPQMLDAVTHPVLLHPDHEPTAIAFNGGCDCAYFVRPLRAPCEVFVFAERVDEDRETACLGRTITQSNVYVGAIILVLYWGEESRAPIQRPSRACFVTGL